MTITKKDIKKLEKFYFMLNLYLADWKDNNSFFYRSDSYQRDITRKFVNIYGDGLSVAPANDIYKELDNDDKNQVKDMLRAKEISFKASKNTPLHYYKFNYIKIC